MRGVYGFAFDLELPDGSTMSSVRLQGSGGLMGDGLLCALNGDSPTRSAEECAVDLLREAQTEAEQEGFLRVNYPERRWQDRIERVPGAWPTACRPLVSGRSTFWTPGEAP